MSCLCLAFFEHSRAHIYVQLIMSVCSDSGAKCIFVGSFMFSIICMKSSLSNPDGAAIDTGGVVVAGGADVVTGTVCCCGKELGTVGGAPCGVVAIWCDVDCVTGGGTGRVDSVALESRSIRLEDSVEDDADE